MRTPHGRGCLHAAAAGEQYGLLDDLLPRLTDDSLLQATDKDGKSSLDIAHDRGSSLSERVIKKHMRQRRQLKLQALNDDTKKNSSREDGDDFGTTSTTSFNRFVTIKSEDDQFSGANRLLSVRPLNNSSVLSSARSRSSQQSAKSFKQSLYLYRRKTHQSTTNNAEDNHKNCHSGHNHDKCARLPPFVAFQSVSPAEMRMETVDVVPLETMNFEQRRAYNGLIFMQYKFY